MSLHSDLLEQATFLVKREPRRPRQASLRRAISAAYYSLFHLLIFEASRVFVRNDDMIGMIARSYGHSALLRIAKSFARGDLPKNADFRGYATCLIRTHFSTTNRRFSPVFWASKVRDMRAN